MASLLAKVARREAVMSRLQTALGLDLSGLNAKGDAELTEIMRLERIADSVEAQPPADLRSVALVSTDDELKELGLSATAIKKLRDTE